MAAAALAVLCALLGAARGAHIKKAEAAAEAEAPGLRYPHAAELAEALRAVAEAAPPGLARLGSIGTSAEGRPLWVLRLTAGQGPEPGPLPGRPQVKLVGNMHGDEPLARPLLLRLAHELVRAWAAGEPRAQRLLNRTDLHLLPSLNPDGFERARQGACQGQGPDPDPDDAGDAGPGPGRANALGRDLNRSFPDQFAPGPPDLRPVPEVRALMAWMRSNK